MITESHAARNNHPRLSHASMRPRSDDHGKSTSSDSNGDLMVASMRPRSDDHGKHGTSDDHCFDSTGFNEAAIR